MGDLAGSVGDAEPDVSDLGQWMLDKHRAGRTVEALSMFRRARQRGLPLEPQLNDLHRRMLYDDRALSGDADSAWPAPRQLPPPAEGFVGRAAELTALDEHRDGPVLAITGPSGVG
ncbi:MAG: AfsR/SARP family transcriptional regulator, partial [Stackebrandtia sp.]